MAKKKSPKAIKAAQAAEAKRRRFRVLDVLLILVLLVLFCGVVYVNMYSKATDEALDALKGDDTVQVHSINGNAICFEAANPKAGIIFYPGAKVQAEAYAPLLHQLAAKGYTCVLEPMPFNIAMLKKNAADGVQEALPDIKNWYMAGHSMGGFVAANYADDHEDAFQGIILLGSYLSRDNSDSTLRSLCICGSLDGLTTPEKHNKQEYRLPDGTTHVLIEGGNHAQFGNYGTQGGDNMPTISAEEQQKQTVEAIDKFISEAA